MADRYDAVIATKYTDRDGNEKSRFTKVGALFPQKGKDGFKLAADMPITIVPGMADLLFFPPKPRDEGGGGGL